MTEEQLNKALEIKNKWRRSQDLLVDLSSTSEIEIRVNGGSRHFFKKSSNPDLWDAIMKSVNETNHKLCKEFEEL